MKSDLVEALGHTFSSPQLLEQALMHRSVAHGSQRGYERLEFLGDRVLGLVVADLLYDAFPNEDEGAMAKRHVDLVRRETLAEVARMIGLGRHIRLSRGEDEAGGRENEAILADCCEAVIAALYRDGGLEAADGFIRRYWLERLKALERPPQDAKTALQEWAQGKGLPLPDYRTVDRTGPDHMPVFTVSVEVAGQEPAKGEGTSKRAAEQAAAERLLAEVMKNG